MLAEKVWINWIGVGPAQLLPVENVDVRGSVLGYFADHCVRVPNHLLSCSIIR